MDGPVSSSGGYEAGGAFATIGADLTGLRQAEVEAQQIVERIGRMSASVPMIGGGGAAGPSLFGAANGGNTPAFGAGFGASAGGLSGTHRIDIDTSAAENSVRRLGGEMQKLRADLELLQSAASGFTSRGAAVPGNLASEIGNLQSQIAAATPYSSPRGHPQGPSYSAGWANTPFIGAGAHTLIGDLGQMYENVAGPMGLAATGGGVDYGFGLPGTSRTNGRYFIDRYQGFQARQLAAMDELEAGGVVESEAESFARYQAAKGIDPAKPQRMSYLQRRLAFMGATLAFDAFSQVGAGYAQAAMTEAHPELNLIGMAGLGSTFNPFASPYAVATAGSIASITAEQQRMQAWASIPFIGGAIAAQNAPVAFRLQQDLGFAQRNLQGAAFLANTQTQLGIGAAELSGNPVEAARAQAESAERPLAVAAGVDLRAMFGNRSQFSASEATEYREAQRQQQQAARDLSDMRRQNELKIGLAQDIYDTRLAVLGSGIGANLSRASAYGLRGSGDAMGSLLADQAADRLAYIGATDTALAGINDPSLLVRTAAERFAGFRSLQAGQGYAQLSLRRDISAQRNSAFAAGFAAEMGVNDPFAAQFIHFNSETENQARAYGAIGAGGDYANIVREQASAMIAVQRQSSTLSLADAQAVVSAANARTQRNTLGAQLARFGPMETAAGFLPSMQQGMALAQINAERGAVIAEDQRHQFMLKEEYTARASVAQAIVNDQPINAQAIAHVAAATLEVQRADPRNRAQAVATAQEELRAAWHDTVAQRGGGVAIDMGAGFAAGLPGMFGLDLANRRADQMAAAGTFKSGISGLPGAAAAADGQNVSDDQAHQLLSTIASVLQQMLQKGGPALFAN